MFGSVPFGSNHDQIHTENNQLRVWKKWRKEWRENKSNGKRRKKNNFHQNLRFIIRVQKNVFDFYRIPTTKQQIILIELNETKSIALSTILFIQTWNYLAELSHIRTHIRTRTRTRTPAVHVIKRFYVLILFISEIEVNGKWNIEMWMTSNRNSTKYLDMLRPPHRIPNLINWIFFVNDKLSPISLLYVFPLMNPWTVYKLI